MGVFSALLCSRCGGLRQALVEVAGFAEDNVYLMTSQMSGRKEPTHVNVSRQLSLLSGRVKAEDAFIFYFSGHGITKAE